MGVTRRHASPGPRAQRGLPTRTNPYSLELATNLLLYALGRPLITDIHARRNARGMLASFQAQKLLILSPLEWAEKFEANTMPLRAGGDGSGNAESIRALVEGKGGVVTKTLVYLTREKAAADKARLEGEGAGYRRRSTLDCVGHPADSGILLPMLPGM